MSVSEYIQVSLEKSSWIRKMFEEGARLKSIHGDENVYDFSLGNPDVAPPVKFQKTLEKKAGEEKPGIHGYMPNAGYPDVRAKIADTVNRIHGSHLSTENIIMTVGAAGGMNTVLKTILDPGDEVIILKPFFVEYRFYIQNHGGVPVDVSTTERFGISLDTISAAITEKTRAVIINSPNNPSGRIYPDEEIRQLASLLRSRSGDRCIYLVSDEPYREIVFGNRTVPSVLEHYENSILVYSYSKSLSLAGERIGYLAVNDRAENIELLCAGLVLSNRILGYVNAPALMQRVVGELDVSDFDLSLYEKRRDIFCTGLEEAGYEFIEPEGAFYLFCRAPGGDDVNFVNHLMNYQVLAVPGSGFGAPGWFRLSFSVGEKVIRASFPAFKKALEEYR